MARIALGALTTLNLSTHLDPMFTELYDLRELISTNGYTAATPFGYISSVGLWGFGTSSPAARIHAVSTSNQFLTSETTNNGGASAWRFKGLTTLGAAVSYDIGINIQSDNSFEIYDRQNTVLVDRYVAGGSGYRATYTNGFERMRVDNAGNVLVNRTSQASGGALEVAGNLVFKPSGSAPTIGANNDMTFQLVSNTSLKILVRGSDGVTRSNTLTLA